MKYKNIYNEVEAICYNGYNFKEANEFCDNRLSWKSEEMSWSDDNPPKDLIITFGDDFLVPGNYIIKTRDNDFELVEGYDFIKLFKEVKDGE